MRDSQKCVARQQCSHETDETGRQSRHASSAPSSLPAEHPHDALRKRAYAGCLITANSAQTRAIDAELMPQLGPIAKDLRADLVG